MSGIEDRSNAPRWEGAPRKFTPQVGPRAEVKERDICGIAAIVTLVVAMVLYCTCAYIAMST